LNAFECVKIKHAVRAPFFSCLRALPLPNQIKLAPSPTAAKERCHNGSTSLFDTSCHPVTNHTLACIQSPSMDIILRAFCT
jgi:hypothetical protein